LDLGAREHWIVPLSSRRKEVAIADRRSQTKFERAIGLMKRSGVGGESLASNVPKEKTALDVKGGQRSAGARTAPRNSARLNSYGAISMTSTSAYLRLAMKSCQSWKMIAHPMMEQP